MLVQEQRGTGAFATYLNGARGPECRIDETQPGAETGYTVNKTTFQRGPTKWYVYDGLGSVVGEVDPSGNLTSSPKYDVYGLVRSNTGTASSAMGFVGGLGHLSEAGTGLIYMRARYYDPQLGRFSSQDMKGNGTNWFVYCSNNPVSRYDPDGKEDMAGLGTAMGISGTLMGITCGFTDWMYQMLTKGQVDWTHVILSAAGGFLVGAALGWGAVAVAGDTGLVLTALSCVCSARVFVQAMVCAGLLGEALGGVGAAVDYLSAHATQIEILSDTIDME